VWCGSLQQRRDARWERQKRETLGEGADKIDAELRRIDDEIDASKQDVLKLKEDCADKLDALRAMLGGRSADLQQQVAMAGQPGGGGGGAAEAATQWDLADLDPGQQPAHRSCQTEGGADPDAQRRLDELQAMLAQRDSQLAELRKEASAASAAPPTDWAACQTDFGIDPEVQARIDELLALLAAKEGEIANLTAAKVRGSVRVRLACETLQ
jgi:hypothetical protein